MRKYGFMGLVTLSLASMACVSPSNAQTAGDITLCSGSPGRNYDSVMRGIGQELTNRGYNVTIKNLGGSEDIIRNLENGSCSYGPAQKDIHYKMAIDDAQINQSVTPIALLYHEAMTMFCSSDSNIDELSDITGDTTVIVDSIGSGSSLTWENMVDVETKYGNKSDWINAKTSFTPLDEATAALSLGQADCAFGVGAVPSNWALELQKAGMTVAWVYDKDLNDLMVGKSSLYPAIRVPYGAYESKFDTYAIPAILFRSSAVKKNPEVDSLIKRIAPSMGSKYNSVKIQ